MDKTGGHRPNLTMRQNRPRQVTPTESYFKSHDHHRLYYQTWQAPKAKAVLIFVHGINEHSGRYSHAAHYFYNQGFTVYLFDQRGHGKSDGLRSYVDHFGQYSKDLHEFTKLTAEQEKNKKIFMVGHSMGGQIVINYISQYPQLLSGFITSSANIEVAIKISFLKRLIGEALVKFFPKLTLKNQIDLKFISRDPKIVKAYRDDPLVSKQVTLKLGSEFLANQKILMDQAKKIRLPALVMHGGDDKICTPEGSKKFYRYLASPNKEIKIYPKFYHEIFNEIGKKKVFSNLLFKH